MGWTTGKGGNDMKNAPSKRLRLAITSFPANIPASGHCLSNEISNPLGFHLKKFSRRQLHEQFPKPSDTLSLCFPFLGWKHSWYFDLQG